jgi:HEPN domain-containing protein
MLPIRDLRRIARARLRDAEVLLRSRRFDGSVYVCGYAVEIGLKARICRALSWKGFPDSSKDFQGYTSFRTHNLDVLLHLSGREEMIKNRYFTEWSVVAKWEPESRYGPIGKASAADANDMLRSAREVLGAL